MASRRTAANAARPGSQGMPGAAAEARSLRTWASARNGRPSYTLSVSKTPSPYRNPRSCTDTAASWSGTNAPLTYAHMGLPRRLAQRLEQGPGLVQRFGILPVRIRVRHDARAGVERHLATPADQRADRDVPVHVARPREVADRSGVEPAGQGFDLLDDLQAANLRHAGDGAAGKDCVEQIEPRC